MDLLTDFGSQVKMKLHVWSGIETSPTFDPECLAAMWLTRFAEVPVEIVYSNNVYMSPDQRLPCLVDDADAGSAVSGYAEIVHYLSQQGYEVGDLSAQNIALLANLDRATTLTHWTLFCHKENYEKITRPQISAAVAFPMQYNVAMSLQQNAVSRCKSEGITHRKKPPKEKGLTKTHEQVLEANRNRKAMVSMSQETMQVLTLGEKVYQLCANIMTNIDQQESPAKFLLLANIYLQTLPGLTQRPLETVIDEFPALKQPLPDLEFTNVSHPGTTEYTLPNWFASLTPWTSPWPLGPLGPGL